MPYVLGQVTDTPAPENTVMDPGQPTPSKTKALMQKTNWTTLDNETWGLLAVASAAASAWHGYKRNNGDWRWAVGWGLAGGILPIITPVIAVAQGFGKPEGAAATAGFGGSSMWSFKSPSRWKGHKPFRGLGRTPPPPEPRDSYRNFGPGWW